MDSTAPKYNLDLDCRHIPDICTPLVSRQLLPNGLNRSSLRRSLCRKQGHCLDERVICATPAVSCICCSFGAFVLYTQIMHKHATHISRTFCRVVPQADKIATQSATEFGRTSHVQADRQLKQPKALPTTMSHPCLSFIRRYNFLLLLVICGFWFGLIC